MTTVMDQIYKRGHKSIREYWISVKDICPVGHHYLRLCISEHRYPENIRTFLESQGFNVEPEQKRNPAGAGKNDGAVKRLKSIADQIRDIKAGM